MTREEAILRLEVLKDFSQNNELKNMHEAIDMAIRSLEAWNSLEEEMETEIYSYDAFPDIWYGISESYDIIKKYLKEVQGE